MRTEKDMENITENAADEEIGVWDYCIACCICIALGIAAYALAWVVGSCIYNMGSYDSVLFWMAVGGVGLFFVSIAFLFVYIIYVAGEGKTYKDILWTMSWATSTLGMAMFAVPSIVEKVI